MISVKGDINVQLYFNVNHVRYTANWMGNNCCHFTWGFSEQLVAYVTNVEGVYLHNTNVRLGLDL